MLPSAPQPELVRAVTKNEEIVTQLKDEIQDVVMLTLGQQYGQYREEIDFLTNSAYYLSTTGVGTFPTKVLTSVSSTLHNISDTIDSQATLLRQTIPTKTTIPQHNTLVDSVKLIDKTQTIPTSHITQTTPTINYDNPTSNLDSTISEIHKVQNSYLSRTLGEEYCSLLPVESKTLQSQPVNMIYSTEVVFPRADTTNISNNNNNKTTQTSIATTPITEDTGYITVLSPPQQAPVPLQSTSRALLYITSIFLPFLWKKVASLRSFTIPIPPSFPTFPLFSSSDTSNENGEQVEEPIIQQLTPFQQQMRERLLRQQRIRKEEEQKQQLQQQQPEAEVDAEVDADADADTGAEEETGDSNSNQIDPTLNSTSNPSTFQSILSLFGKILSFIIKMITKIIHKLIRFIQILHKYTLRPSITFFSSIYTKTRSIISYLKRCIHYFKIQIERLWKYIYNISIYISRFLVTVSPSITELYLIIFYLFGGYMSLSHHILNIKHVLLSNSSNMTVSYVVIGWIMITRVLIHSTQMIYYHYTTQLQKSERLQRRIQRVMKHTTAPSAVHTAGHTAGHTAEGIGNMNIEQEHIENIKGEDSTIVITPKISLLSTLYMTGKSLCNIDIESKDIEQTIKMNINHVESVNKAPGHVNETSYTSNNILTFDEFQKKVLAAHRANMNNESDKKTTPMNTDMGTSMDTTIDTIALSNPSLISSFIQFDEGDLELDSGFEDEGDDTSQLDNNNSNSNSKNSIPLYSPYSLDSFADIYSRNGIYDFDGVHQRINDQIATNKTTTTNPTTSTTTTTEYDKTKKHTSSSSLKHIVDERPNPMCNICYSERRDAAVTPCGHVYCWICLSQALTKKNECPTCREVCLPAQIIRLFQYQ